MLAERPGQAAESAATAGRAWPIHDALATEEAIHVAETHRNSPSQAAGHLHGG
jgi:hypothetical protein